MPRAQASVSFYTKGPDR
jgi:hypothetical protein